MTKTFKLAKEYFLFAILIALAVIIAAEAKYRAVVLDGIMLWAACVLPSLFPYFVLTAMLSSLGVTGKMGKMLSPLTLRLFNTGGAVGYALFMSVLSGYPVGAKIVSDLKIGNVIGEEESVRAAALCSTSSPMFVIGSVGSVMFSDPMFGICLFSCHLAAAFAVGIIFSFYKRKHKPEKSFAPKAVKCDNVLYESVYSSVISVLVVGGLITVFYLFTEILSDFGIFDPLIAVLARPFGESTAKSITYGIFECTKGLKALSALGSCGKALPAAAFICGFGGISVIAQSAAYLKKAKIRIAPFVFSKILAAFIGAILAVVPATFFF